MPKGMPANLRDFDPSASDAQHVDDTPMLNTTAREPAENQSGKNTNEELVHSTPNFGSLGAKGRH